MSDLHILTFSWNAEAVRLCDSMNYQEAKTSQAHEQQTSSYFGGMWSMASRVGQAAGSLAAAALPCTIADFFNDMRAKIQLHNPDIIIIGFQEDAKPGSYFHSDLLGKEMPSLGYDYVKRTRLMGVGVTTYKAAKELDVKGRGLRLSVFARPDLAKVIEIEEQELRSYTDSQSYNPFDTAEGHYSHICTSSVTRGKGGTVSYITLPGRGVLAVVNVHLPFNAGTLIEAKRLQDKLIRQDQLNYANICFNNIVRSLILYPERPGVSPPTSLDRNAVTHAIVLGDLNYRLYSDDSDAEAMANKLLEAYENENKEAIRQIYLNHDELIREMKKENIYGFQEGVDNQGPLFMPTCKMAKGRRQVCKFDKRYEQGFKDIPTELRHKASFTAPDCWKLGKFDQRIPSWCDRILYNKVQEDNPNNISCTLYDRFDIGDAMNKSDHAGVYAVLEISQI